MTVVGVAMLHPIKHKRALRAADTAALLGGPGAQLDTAVTKRLHGHSVSRPWAMVDKHALQRDYLK